MTCTCSARSMPCVASYGILVRDTPARWTSGLRKFLTADAIAASNSIEGFRVSTVDVADLMEGEHDVDVSEENLAETVAYQHMMTYIQTLHDAPDFAYSTGQLNALHWMLQGHRHSRGKPAGQWRKGPVSVPDTRDPSIAAYTAPDAEEVPALMTELADWLDAPQRNAFPGAGGDGSPASGVDPPVGRGERADVQVAADADDRPGGSSWRPEFSSIEAWLGRPGNTWEYYRELASCGATYEPEQDLTSWVRFNLMAYHEQAQAVRNRLDRAARVWRLLADFAEDRRWTSASSPPCTMWP